MFATTLLTVAELLLLTFLVPWIALERRTPVATLAWILLVVALPGVGPMMYYVLGHRRVKRSRFKRLRARLGLRAARDRLRVVADASDRDPVDPRARQLMALATQVSELPPSTLLSARLLHDGDETYAALEEAIRAARHHVHLEYYIYEPDRVGTRLRDLLVDKARSGVEVRLLVDGMGSRRLSRRFLAPLRQAGARVAWFSPVSFPRFRPRLANFRTHRKMVIVDGVIGFTGGVNITDEESAAVMGTRAYRDTHVRLEGAAVRWLQLVFLEDWSYVAGQAPTDSAYFPEPTEPGRFSAQIIASGPDEPWHAIQKFYFAAITAARERVLLTTPYFVPDEPILTALVTAALRGVQVRILVPRRSDSRTVMAAARSFYGELLAAGVKVYEYTPRMLHTKTLVVDSFFAAVGTANMDSRSFRLNYEVSAVTYDAVGAERLAQAFAQDLTHARGVARGELANDSTRRRLFQAAARLLAPIL